MNRINLGVGLIILLALQGMIYAFDIIFRHGADPSWPNHARYHVVVSGIHIIAIAFGVLWLALKSVKSESREGWMAIAVLMIGTALGWPLARFITHEPTPLEAALFMGGSFLGVLIALGLTRPKKS